MWLGFFNAAFTKQNGPQACRRKIEFPTDSVPEFELVDTASDTQHRREESETKEMEEEAQKQREEARMEEKRHSSEEGKAEKHTRTDRKDTEMDTCTEGGGEAGIAQCTQDKRKST